MQPAGHHRRGATVAPLARGLLGLAATLALASPLQADVTITQKTSGKGLGQAAGGQTVIAVKGNKMRTDQTGGMADGSTTIIDLDAQQLVILRPARKQAEVHDLRQLSSELDRNVAASDIQVSLTPTGDSKEMLGRTVDGYDLRITIPVAMGPQTFEMELTGPVWIAKDAPGTADYVGFYRTAAEKGLFFGTPQEAKAAPAQAKGLAEMYEAMASTGGLPYSTEIRMSFAGSGMMAEMMNKMGGMGIETQVTSVSTDPIPDERFSIPADYETTRP